MHSVGRDAGTRPGDGLRRRSPRQASGRANSTGAAHGCRAIGDNSDFAMDAYFL